MEKIHYLSSYFCFCTCEECFITVDCTRSTRDFPEVYENKTTNALNLQRATGNEFFNRRTRILEILKLHSIALLIVRSILINFLKLVYQNCSVQQNFFNFRNQYHNTPAKLLASHL